MGGTIERIAAERQDLEATLATLSKHPETYHLARELAEVMRKRFGMIVPEVPTFTKVVECRMYDISTIVLSWIRNLDTAVGGIGYINAGGIYAEPTIFEIQKDKTFVVIYGRTAILLESRWLEKTRSFEFSGFDHIERIEGDKKCVRVHVRGVCAALDCVSGELTYEHTIPHPTVAELPRED